MERAAQGSPVRGGGAQCRGLVGKVGVRSARPERISRSPGDSVTLCCPVAGKVLLRDVQAITLHRGQYTTSRRTAAVPQLQCTGGSAGCARVPEVVQCHNKGWDGSDVQVTA